MEEKIKEIISVFIKVPAEQIAPSTAIGRSALQSSILMHRMYARLADEGLVVENYGDIRVFGDLWPQRPFGNAHPNGQETQPAMPGQALAAIGIDIEEIAALPATNDFRKEAFYKMNFAAAEIAWCILQPDPYSSFAGLFAVKEALVKADGQFRGRAFNSMEIDHSPEGKPLFPGFVISISHAGGLAVAVAARSGGNLPEAPDITASVQAGPSPGKQGGSPVGWVAWIALLLSVMALMIVLMH